MLSDNSKDINANINSSFNNSAGEDVKMDKVTTAEVEEERQANWQQALFD